MIIDFHTHVYPDAIASKGVEYVGSFYGLPVDSLNFGKIDHLNKCCEDAKVDIKVILAVAIRADQVKSVNNWLSSLLDEHTYGFGAMNPNMDNPIKELERFGDLGFSGIKYHPDMQKFNIDDERMFQVYEWAEGKMPIYFHLGDPKLDFSRPNRLSRVLDRFPNLTVIGAHLGGYRRWEEAKKYLCGRNVYFDTSSALPYMPKGMAEEIISLHSEDKILFGTDYPVTTPKRELEYFNALKISEDVKQKILWKNACKLLKITQY